MMHRLHREWTKLESLIGLLATFIIGFAPPVLLFLFGLASLVNEENAKDVPAWICFGGVLVTGPMAVWTARMANSALHHCLPGLRKTEEIWMRKDAKLWLPFQAEEPDTPAPIPLALVMATRLPRIPFFLAPLLSAWWLAHFSSGILVCWGSEVWVEHSFDRPSPWVTFGVSRGLALAFMFASSLYLLLAVGVFVRRPGVLQVLWRWRFVISLALALATAGLQAWEWIMNLYCIGGK